MKRYSMVFESDKRCGSEWRDGKLVPSYNHQYGMASSLKTAKGYISKCRKTYLEEHPRNFRVYDHLIDGEKAIVVYQEN